MNDEWGMMNDGGKSLPIRRGRLTLVLLPALALASGCARELDSFYGRSSGVIGAESVNGTAVLREMFAEYGHRTNAWYRLSPRLRNNVDTIVWFPSDHGTPSQAARDWLEDWLSEVDGRTLIYVGRDYDAAPDYWRKMKRGAPPEQLAELNRLVNEAQAAAQFQRVGLPASQECDWFTLRTDRPHRDVRDLVGPPEWIDGVDPSLVEIALDARLQPPEGIEPLLSTADGEVIASSQQVGGGELIVVANGSFLLNMPLVNREHRKLAGSLVRHVGPESYVMFLETTHAPEIMDKEPELSMPTGLELLGVAPFGTILLHAMLLGLLYSFWRLPIFGVPRELAKETTSDFGQHVTALGTLLAKTRDEAYARARLGHVWHMLHPEAAIAPPVPAPAGGVAGAEAPLSSETAPQDAATDPGADAPGAPDDTASATSAGDAGDHSLGAPDDASTASSSADPPAEAPGAP